MTNREPLANDTSGSLDGVSSPLTSLPAPLLASAVSLTGPDAVVKLVDHCSVSEALFAALIAPLGVSAPECALGADPLSSSRAPASLAEAAEFASRALDVEGVVLHALSRTTPNDVAVLSDAAVLNDAALLDLAVAFAHLLLQAMMIPT